MFSVQPVPDPQKKPLRGTSGRCPTERQPCGDNWRLVTTLPPVDRRVSASLSTDGVRLKSINSPRPGARNRTNYAAAEYRDFILLVAKTADS